MCCGCFVAGVGLCFGSTGEHQRVLEGAEGAFLAVEIGGTVVLEEERDGAVAGDAGDCFGVEFEDRDHVGYCVAFELVNTIRLRVDFGADCAAVPVANCSAVAPALGGR